MHGSMSYLVHLTSGYSSICPEASQGRLQVKHHFICKVSFTRAKMGRYRIRSAKQIDDPVAWVCEAENPPQGQPRRVMIVRKEVFAEVGLCLIPGSYE